MADFGSQSKLDGTLFALPLTPPHEPVHVDAPSIEPTSKQELCLSIPRPAEYSPENLSDHQATSNASVIKLALLDDIVQHGSDAKPPLEAGTRRDSSLVQPLRKDLRYRGVRSLSETIVVKQDYDTHESPVAHRDGMTTSLTAPSLPEEAIETEPPSSSALTPLTPLEENGVLSTRSKSRRVGPERVHDKRPRNLTIDVSSDRSGLEALTSGRRPRTPRALSTPASVRSPVNITYDSRRVRTFSRSEQLKPRPSPGLLPPTSPLPSSIPLPPLSLSTYLQYELSSQRVSILAIHRSTASDFPYESSQVKIERLLNFLLLPLHLEGCLWFGVLACLDCWLYTFTILPLRMVKSIYMLLETLLRNTFTEIIFILEFTFNGIGRFWRRCNEQPSPSTPQISRSSSEVHLSPERGRGARSHGRQHHRRVKSMPSNLQPNNKADLLKGALIISTCLILLRFDASRMYHWVRGQAAIKLYVIYNLLEVCDRLLSALGQDVLECLFSREALERKPNGHSKVLRPLWLFTVALVYSVVHSTALFYQVVTLNVAVNSYSNALITLLLSNQFVEIKGTVFKKFEKESLFQITCSDIVERFQLWHMLMIIASRNIIETGGFGMSVSNLLDPAATATASAIVNTTHAAPPRMASSILPSSFNIVPSMLKSISAYVPTISQVLGPFVIVLGSEMAIDWLKHAYIGKFNNTRPVIYGRFLDVLCKDYYTNAFGDQNLIKRLGLPIIPLSCLMIRAGFQTYQMFVASWVPASHAKASATLTELHQQYSVARPVPSSTVGMLVRRMDDFLNRLPAVVSSSDFTSYFTTTLVFLLMFLVLLVIKLILGMGLLAFSRARYQSMKEHEHLGHQSYHVDGGRRVGGWGVVEVDDSKRRWIYDDDPTGLQMTKHREAKDRAKREQEKSGGFGIGGLEKVIRYDMVAKRIW